MAQAKHTAKNKGGTPLKYKMTAILKRSRYQRGNFLLLIAAFTCYNYIHGKQNVYTE